MTNVGSINCIPQARISLSNFLSTIMVVRTYIKYHVCVV
eukprot:CAMPEP_0114240128 /NCGR_PEP_ID=MMETSP0058-20121206/8868_1 /TAXON_ID=36894 /ORGANISM="Pyramimonas parkeae, CCMP726" /LENGTH=38 /DNA_ID= /DNA_START= /DNA_END= /DNA_ORIENTATION=